MLVNILMSVVITLFADVSVSTTQRSFSSFVNPSGIAISPGLELSYLGSFSDIDTSHTIGLSLGNLGFGTVIRGEQTSYVLSSGARICNWLHMGYGYKFGDTKDILHPGLRFPPGHFAHIVVLFGLNLLRVLGVIIVIFAFLDGFNVSEFRATNYWNFFVLGLLPAIFWFGFFLVLAEWFKFQWMGSPERWEQYIEAYTVELPEPPNEGIDEEYR